LYGYFCRFDVDIAARNPVGSDIKSIRYDYAGLVLTRTICWIILTMSASFTLGCGSPTNSEQNPTSAQTPQPDSDSFPRLTGPSDGPIVVTISELGYACHIACRDAYSAPAIVDLGRLNGGRNSSYASAISEDGKVVVGEVNDGLDGRSRAFKWTATTGMASLSSMGWSSNAQAVNADGSVIVGSVAIDGDAVPFRWSAREGIVLLSSARGPNNRSVAKGVSADGAVIVGNAKGPFRWTATTGMKLMDGGFLSYVNGLSADGSRAIGWSLAVPGDEDHSVAVYWDADGRMHAIGRYRSSGMAVATAVSANGQWVAGFAQDDSAEHHNVAFLCQAAVLHEAWLDRRVGSAEMATPSSGFYTTTTHSLRLCPIGEIGRSAR
jgi:probable HAF family extracellular repeat protein